MRRPVVVLALLAVLLAPTLVLPRTVEAQEPRVWFEPSSGNCEDKWTLVGEAYPPDATVEIVIPGMNESEFVAESTTDSSGSFTATLPDNFPSECRPGSLLGLAAQAGSGDARVWRVASYEVASPYQLQTVSCSDQQMTLRGSGFPVGVTLDLWWGQDQPFAHNFAEVGEATTNARGTFEETFRIGCLPPGDTITARVGPIGVRLDSTVPSPAATGHGLARSADRGVPFALAAVALAILGGARLLTWERRGAEVRFPSL